MDLGYIRVSKNKFENCFDENNYKFNPKSAVRLTEGPDVTIVTNGETLIETINAAKFLEKRWNKS